MKPLGHLLNSFFYFSKPGRFILCQKCHLSRLMRKPTICIYAKTKAQISFAVTAKLISAFVFAKGIVQSIPLLLVASSIFLCFRSSVCVGPVQKPHYWYSYEVAHFTHVATGVILPRPHVPATMRQFVLSLLQLVVEILSP